MVLARRRALELKPSSPSYALNLMHGLELEQDYTQALHLALHFCTTTQYVPYPPAAQPSSMYSDHTCCHQALMRVVTAWKNCRIVVQSSCVPCILDFAVGHSGWLLHCYAAFFQRLLGGWMLHEQLHHGACLLVGWNAATTVRHGKHSVCTGQFENSFMFLFCCVLLIAEFI